MPVTYFAYGANMSRDLMRERCPDHGFLGAASLADHRLAFTRRSIKTGTGVADILPAPGEVVWGALYELNEHDLDTLDRAEGRGWAYEREQRHVRRRDGSLQTADTYVVIDKARETRPSTEYLNRLHAAARELQLPDSYIERIDAAASCQAP